MGENCEAAEASEIYLYMGRYRGDANHHGGSPKIDSARAYLIARIPRKSDLVKNAHEDLQRSLRYWTNGYSSCAWT